MMDEQLETRDPNLATRNSQPATPAHTIRLRHPWQCETKADTLIWSRKFNWPAELPEGERVRLVIENAEPAIVVKLNDSAIEFDPAHPADITGLLAVHNRLAISARSEKSPQSDECPYEVRLEILPAC